MKKWLLRIFIVLLVILLASSIFGYYYISGLSPDYDEDLSLTILEEEVDVHYDEFGIPHIYAQDIGDAYKALGYVHAKDRLWQMDLIRRIAPGRLSELFGEAMLENDKFFRTVSLAEQSKMEAERFQKEAKGDLRKLVMGYVEGVNAYIDHGSETIEHKLIGVQMEPFTIEDVYNVIGYMSFSFSVAHRTEPIMDYILSEYGSDYLNELDVHVAPGSEFIKSEISPDYSPLSLYIDDLFEELPAPELIGSNSWVIAPEKTKTNSVIFANDPHIGYSQPSVWYEAHITTPSFELYGYHIAGFPIAQIGHTRHHAIGLTMFENDDVDYYREKTNPENANQYWAKDQWLSYESRKEIIKVKDGEDVEVSIRSTRHGPVISDVVEHIDNDDPVSMWWTYQKFPLRLLEASQKIIMSESMEEAREGASLLHAPGLNVMYGDVDGNVAWWACAKLPKRPAHVNSKLILDGASGADDITEYYDFNDNPQAVNPAQGFVYSANNQSVGTDSTLHPGYYLPEDRARRIVKLLESKDDWTTDDVKRMLLDVTSENALEIRTSLVGAIHTDALNDQEIKALEIVSNWKGAFDVDEVAPSIYIKWLYHTLHMMMGDELGDRFEVFNGTHVMKRSVQPMFASVNSPWWDDVSTTSVKESRSDIVMKAFQLTMSQLENQLGASMSEWKWGSVHTLEHAHAFGTNETLKPYFNVGPFELSGATDVINNQQYTLSDDGTYETKAGPSSRRAINMADLESDSWSILPTGQSGNVMSPHYKDQAEMFINGEFRRQLMNKEEIISSSKHHTKLKAKK